MVRKILRSQQGMSIVQVLIAAGMMGGLALVMGKLGQNQSRMQKSANQNLELNELTNRIQKHLLNPNSCAETFEFASGLTKTGAKYAGIDQIVNFKGTPILTVGKISPNFNILNMTAERVSDQEMKFGVTFERRGKRGMGAKTITKYFNLDVVYDAGKIEECYSHLDGAAAQGALQACISLGGTFTEKKAGDITTIYQSATCTGLTCPPNTSQISSEFDNGRCEKECRFDRNVGECKDTALQQKLCETEQKVMALSLENGTDSCGNSVSIEDDSQKFTSGSNSSFNLPTDAIPGTLRVHVIGGGGGGAEGDRANGACEGQAATEDIQKLPEVAPGLGCRVWVGSGGAGGNDSDKDDSDPGNKGGDSYVKCDGVRVAYSRGGDGGRDVESDCKTTKDGKNGKNSFFNGSTRSGGAGGNKGCGSGRHGKDGSIGAGGGGGAEKKSCNGQPGDGGDGGRGEVIFKWKKYSVN